MVYAIVGAVIALAMPAIAAPPDDTVVPVPAGEATVREVWEGIVHVEAQVVAGLPHPERFDEPAALPGERPAQIPLEQALDAIAEPLGVIWFRHPSGLVLMYERPTELAPVAWSGVHRDMLATLCTLWELVEALPSDEDRARFLAGEWVQPLSEDDPFARVTARAARNFGRGKVAPPAPGQPPAVWLCCLAVAMRRAGPSDPIAVQRPILGHEDVIPPRDRLSIAASPLAGGPRSLCTAAWRGRIAAFSAVQEAPSEPWDLGALAPEGVSALRILHGQPVRGAELAPTGAETVLRACTVPGSRSAVSALFDHYRVLISVREQPDEAILGALVTVLGAEMRDLDGTFVVAPADVITDPWVTSTANRILRDIVRPSARSLLVGTGGDPSWADEAWRSLVWQPWDGLGAGQQAALGGALAMAAVGEAPGDGTLSVSEVSTRVECDLRLARPEEDWDLTGPVNGYSVGSWDYVMVARMGPFESSIGQAAR